MRRIVGIAVVLIVFLIVSLMGVAATGSSAEGEEPVRYREYRVKPGDTLWAIAKGHIDGNKDIRKYIYDIMKENRMENPDLMVGQVLRIPVGH